MGGTIALLTGQGMRVLLVDLCDGEPSDFAEPGVRVAQARHAAALWVGNLLGNTFDYLLCRFSRGRFGRA